MSLRASQRLADFSVGFLTARLLRALKIAHGDWDYMRPHEAAFSKCLSNQSASLWNIGGLTMVEDV